MVDLCLSVLKRRRGSRILIRVEGWTLTPQVRGLQLQFHTVQASNVTPGTKRAQKEQPMTEDNFFGGGWQMHTLIVLSGLRVVPGVSLHLVHKNCLLPQKYPWFLALCFGRCRPVCVLGLQFLCNWGSNPSGCSQLQMIPSNAASENKSGNIKRLPQVLFPVCNGQHGKRTQSLSLGMGPSFQLHARGCTATKGISR